MDRTRTLGGVLFVALALLAAPLGADGKKAETAEPDKATPDKAAVETPPAATKAEATPDDDLLIRRERYFYSSFSRRDPFKSLVSGAFNPMSDNELLDIGELSLVGIVWGEDDRFAVVQDKRDHVHTLREGDRVVNGKVTNITQTSLTAQHYFFGETANVTIHLNQGEGSHETR